MSRTRLQRKLKGTVVVGLLVALALGCRQQAEPIASADSLFVNDVSGLNPTRVESVVRADRVDTLRTAIDRARREGRKVSIVGARHSQGGHQFVEAGVLLDMTGLDSVLSVDVENRVVTVEPGATWADVQNALNPHGLAVKVMQSSNIFTVGGSISVNAHGRDPRCGPIISTVRAFRLLQADGTIVDVDRETNPELFGLALGGFGLFGVIISVDLDVTDNTLYQRHVVAMNYAEYPEYFKTHIRGNDRIGLESARLSIAPGEGFLRDAYSREYREIEGDSNQPLSGESNVARDRFVFGLSRKWDWGKRLRWYLQTHVAERPGSKQVVTRNSAMRPPIKFIEYHSDRDTDILQEYFVPLDSFVVFIDDVRRILRDNHVNLLHLTIRYVPPNNEAVLSYATDEVFAVVMYMNIERSPGGIARAGKWTRALVDAAIDHGGTYYLVYQQFPTGEQFRRAYPRAAEFFAKKHEYDPTLLFDSKFYQAYGF